MCTRHPSGPPWSHQTTILLARSFARIASATRLRERHAGPRAPAFLSMGGVRSCARVAERVASSMGTGRDMGVGPRCTYADTWWRGAVTCCTRRAFHSMSTHQVRALRAKWFLSSSAWADGARVRAAGGAETWIGLEPEGSGRKRVSQIRPDPNTDTILGWHFPLLDQIKRGLERRLGQGEDVSDFSVFEGMKGEIQFSTGTMPWHAASPACGLWSKRDASRTTALDRCVLVHWLVARHRRIDSALLALVQRTSKASLLTCEGLFPVPDWLYRYSYTTSAFLGDIKCSQDCWLVDSLLVTCQSPPSSLIKQRKHLQVAGRPRAWQCPPSPRYGCLGLVYFHPKNLIFFKISRHIKFLYA